VSPQETVTVRNPDRRRMVIGFPIGIIRILLGLTDEFYRRIRTNARI
jgi:hypothetical protein